MTLAGNVYFSGLSHPGSFRRQIPQWLFKQKTARSDLHVRSKITQHVEAESKRVVSRGWEERETGRCWSKGTKQSCKINKFWRKKMVSGRGLSLGIHMESYCISWAKKKFFLSNTFCWKLVILSLALWESWKITVKGTSYSSVFHFKINNRLEFEKSI